MDSRQGGFTLIELLVVISIIGVLSTVAMTSLNGARTKSRDVKRKAEIAEIRKALELYYADHGNYPRSDGALSPNDGWSNSNDASWNDLQTALAPYMQILPRDPVNTSSGWPNTGSYTYTYYSLGYDCNQQWYMIVYRLEADRPTSPGARRCTGGAFNYTSYQGNMTVGECKQCGP